jgi:uncharacterized protein YqcC (DUF446 family)
MPRPYSTVKTAIDAIEAEMKSIGLWQAAPLRPEQYHFQQAFGMDTMAYSQWLQFIFIPRVNNIIAEHGQFPKSRSVGVQAMREFDGVTEASRLLALLSEFGAMFR